MVMTDPKNWWCCLRPEERNTIRALIIAYLINPTYVGTETYNALVAATGLSASTLVLAFFERYYGLHHELIPCGEDCFIDAMVFTDGFWAQMVVFSTTPEFICSAPCPFFTFPS